MASASEDQAGRSATHLTGERPGARSRSLRAGRRTVPAWLSIMLASLTCLCLLASTVTIWVGATVLNTDRFVALVAPLRRDPQVIASVSSYIADQVVASLDITGRTASILPAGGQFLVGPLEQSVHDYVQMRAADVLSSDRTQATWQAVERSAHAELVSALRGQPSAVTIADGVLSVDLLPLIAATLSRLQQAVPGLFASAPPIPDLTGMQSPEQQRQALSQALGVQLPPDFGVVTVLRSDNLATVQRIVTALDTLQLVLPLVTLALAAATIWSMASWRRALQLLGIGTAVVVLAAILLIPLLLGNLTASAMPGPAHTIVAALVEILWANLLGVLVGVLIAGVLVAVGAYLAGKPEWLMRLLRARIGAAQVDRM